MPVSSVKDSCACSPTMYPDHPLTQGLTAMVERSDSTETQTGPHEPYMRLTGVQSRVYPASRPKIDAQDKQERNSTNWPDMDPADRDTVSHVLTSQEQKIQAHENQLNAIATGVQQITERQDHFQQEVSAQVNQLNAQLQQISTRLGQLTSLQPTTPAAPPAICLDPLTWHRRRNIPERPVSDVPS
ncbi:hypothetical protein L3Q82_017882 [Scortum barcoo]|uniref:Uncharacterized protein n=1 Tax=Scortum barcoo TaxID=214431 RepID=A0ACB8VIG6_9TELE|nr:hypothetical protein L3Q82_017882 [Scortum barcoo]